MAAASVIAPSGMQAAVTDLNFQGSTLGAFGAGAPVATTTLLGLTFWKSNFNITTIDNRASLGGNPVPSTSNFNNLGSFQLTAAPNTYTGSTFNLQVIFTAPTGIAGSGSAFYTANLIGRVQDAATGGVTIDFDNTPQNFAFSNPAGTGSFTLAVDDMNVQPDGLQEISGVIVAVIPEATALLPLAGVLFCAGATHTFSRRRRNALTA